MKRQFNTSIFFTNFYYTLHNIPSTHRMYTFSFYILLLLCFPPTPLLSCVNINIPRIRCTPSPQDTKPLPDTVYFYGISDYDFSLSRW